MPDLSPVGAAMVPGESLKGEGARFVGLQSCDPRLVWGSSSRLALHSTASSIETVVGGLGFVPGRRLHQVMAAAVARSTLGIHRAASSRARGIPAARGDLEETIRNEVPNRHPGIGSCDPVGKKLYARAGPYVLYRRRKREFPQLPDTLAGQPEPNAAGR